MLNPFLVSLALVFAAGASHIICGVPFVLQKSQYCGPASLSSVMAYYGDAVDQETIGKAVYSPKLEGALLSDLENYSRERGFQTRIGRGRTSELKGFLSADKPVVVLVDLGFWVLSKPHYLVVYGYSERGFIAHNGFEAAHVYPYEEFEKVWRKAGSSFLLIYR